MRKTGTKPKVNGVETSYGALAKALGITRQGCVHRYRLAEKEHGKGKVKIAHISQPVIPKDRALLKMVKSEAERNLKIVKFAIMHGPTHAGLHFKMDPEAIKAMLRDDKV